MAKKKVEVKEVEVEKVEKPNIKPIEKEKPKDPIFELDILNSNIKDLKDEDYSCKTRINKIKTDIKSLEEKIRRFKSEKLKADSDDIEIDSKVESLEKEIVELNRQSDVKSARIKAIPKDIKAITSKIEEIVLAQGKELLANKVEIDMQKSNLITEGLFNVINLTFEKIEELEVKEKENLKKINKFNSYAPLISLDVTKMRAIQKSINPEFEGLEKVKIKQALEYAKVVKKYLDKKVK